MPAKAITTLTAAVRERIRQFLPGVEFTAADVEQITRDLAPDYPRTGETMGSIRCMLQRLRPQGLLFVSAGRYVWPKTEPDRLAAETSSEARRLTTERRDHQQRAFSYDRLADVHSDSKS